MADPVSHVCLIQMDDYDSETHNIPHYCSTFSDGTWSRLLAVATLSMT